MGLTRTRFSQANTAVARIQDPITVLNNESTVANVDVGFLINRNQGIKSNVALFWSEANSEFRVGFSSNTGVPDANIIVSSYADLKVGTLYGNIGGASDIANVYVSGSIIPTANVSYDLGNDNLRFRDLWLSGTTLHIGNQRLTVTNNQWQFTTPTSTVVLGVDSTIGNLTVTGNLNLQGSSSTFDSNNLSLQDSIIELHTQANLAPLTGDDGRDIGIKFHYYKTQDEHAFLGLANDTGYLEWYDSGREGVGNVFTGNTYGTIKSGGAYFVNTTPSTSTTTGALRVAGGVGIAGNLYIANVGDVSANIGTVKNNLATLDANVASYQIYANANAASQQTSITTLTSNAAAQQVSIDNIDANIGSYQLYSNANIGSITTQLGSITSGANANTAAYLLTATGNISAGNLIASGNIYGGLVPTAIFKDIYLGTSTVSLARGSGSLTVDDFNTTGYAAQANSAALATNATKTTVTSNIASGTAYVTFVPATSGNVDQNVNTGLTYNPNSGNLSAYGIITTSGVFWSNGTAWSSAGGGGGTFTASNIAPTTPSLGDQWYYIATDVLYEYVSDGTSSVWLDVSTFAGQNGNITNIPSSTLSGNIVVALNNVYSIGAATGYLQNVYANTVVGNTLTAGNVATTSGVFWANGTSFSSPPGGSTGQIQFNNANAFSGANVLFTSANGNVVITSVTTSTSNTTGALTVGGGIGIAGNIYSNAVYTTTGVYWANNNAAFSSAPGGSTGQMQYNSSSTFAGAANVSYDSTSGNLLIITPTNGTATGGALTVRGGASFVGNIFVTGNILATNQIIAAYSDERLKNRLGAIKDPIHKVKQIETFYYTPNDLALSIGVNDTRIQVGVSAQSIERVLPEVVTSSPINNEYKTVSYERLVPLLIAAIVEQQQQIDYLTEIVNDIQSR